MQFENICWNGFIMWLGNNCNKNCSDFFERSYVISVIKRWKVIKGFKININNNFFPDSLVLTTKFVLYSTCRYVFYVDTLLIPNIQAVLSTYWYSCRHLSSMGSVFRSSIISLLFPFSFYQWVPIHGTFRLFIFFHTFDLIESF